MKMKAHAGTTIMEDGVQWAMGISVRKRLSLSSRCSLLPSHDVQQDLLQRGLGGLLAELIFWTVFNQPRRHLPHISPLHV